jgi:hypothetical protein
MRLRACLLVSSLAVVTACATPAAKVTTARAPEWVKRPDTCFLAGRVVLDPELRPKEADDPLAQVDCRHLRVRLDTDDGSSRRVEADGSFAAGYGECHYQFPDVPPGQNTLGAEFDLAPDLKGRFLFKSDNAFNAVVCNPDSRSWNQSLDLLITLPEVLAPSGVEAAHGKRGMER